MSARSAAPRALVAGLVALLMTVGAFAGPLGGKAQADSAPLDPADPATPTTVTADALPTVQINGVVWSQVVVGDTVYAAGQFTHARPAGAPAGSQETARNNLLAYDIRTGELISSFAPDLNAQALVVAASPDGSRIYVGGDFSQADGEPRNRIAAYSTSTGQLIPDFRPNVSSRVGAIATAGSTVYIGGTFTAVGSVSRHRLAALSAADGALLPWNPIPGTGPVLNRDGNTGTSDVVRALVVTGGGSQVVAGGHFDTLNGVKATGVGALDAVTGETRPFAINQLITNQGTNGAVTGLSTDGTNVYGTAYDYYGPGNLEGGFSAKADGGAVNWINECHGDTYSSHPLGGALYVAGHPHVCSNIGGYHEHEPRIHRYATAVSLAPTGTVGTDTLCGSRVTPDGTIVHKSESSYPCSGTLLQGKPAPSLLTWFPTMAMGSYTGQYQSGWSVAGNEQYVVYGGEFPRVNGTGQQGLVRYALPTSAPNRVGPAAGALAASVDSPLGGMVRVGWSTTNDRDNEHLIYRVYRDGDNANPVHETARSSLWWSPQPLDFVDLGVPAGAHTYRVSAVDPLGNRANSPWMPVEVTEGDIVQRSYSDAVRHDGAAHYWPLGESSGATAYDYAARGDLAVRAGLLGATPDMGEEGAIVDDPDTAFRFRGMTSDSNLGHLSTQTAVAGPQTFTVEAWFRTTSTAGGKIIGFGSSATGNSGSYDRHVYMDTAGQLNFGVYPGARLVVTSPSAYNDGQWHHVAASLSPAGMALHVDGVLVGSRTDTTSAAAYTGYWRVGGDTSWSGAAYFDGLIDEVAVYPTALTPDQVANHHSLGSTGTAINLVPTADFTAATEDLTAALDATGSIDPDGSITSHEWDFGDGSIGTGATVEHVYAAAGTYTVTLTVTDDHGATAQTSTPVTVTDPPNAEPVAAFTAAVEGLSVSLDGSGSSDADGSIASYGWDFGDGATGAGATASHTYAAAGTYTVTLTVTDGEGATGTATESVTVTAGEEPVDPVEPVDPAALVVDTFDRTVTGGLGTADVGGDWTVQFGAARQSVSPGAATVNLAAAGNNTGSFLGGVSHADVDVRASLVVDQAPTGGGTFVYIAARRVSETELYRARLRFLTDGTVRLAVTRLSGSFSETVIGGEVLVPGASSAAGTALNVRLQLQGAGTTELAATVWAQGAAEPATPTLTRTDSTPSLQAPGGVGLSAYLSGSATSPVAIRFTALSVQAIG
ncbi:PKD domain-containing protein [Blastococcus saxobsidens]|uniref:PKD domain-containing protein n=1 Tax=Blastococcus saxobsidens (strain DD2) TaxID=1146883 RepID=H6RSH2_BLASD|nr:PKD domain-containing protein [Blastococcus saxobsidens]CCG01723.1 Conserved secreted protein of unknown function, putative PKD domains [Blastococcus saxobsidens DD2]